jgi:antitoxin (DNA-binding transcriptional repressor) of toxin-antitoxin stability system
MRTTNIRELKHATAKVLGWVEQGETVEVKRRDKVVAILSPPKPDEKPIIKRNFAADIREIFGDRMLPTTGTEIVSEGRGER